MSGCPNVSDSAGTSPSVAALAARLHGIYVQQFLQLYPLDLHGSVAKLLKIIKLFLLYHGQ